ncbi:MAG: SAM-dependent methyltransferase [Actinomycetota bacterium]|nr:SAM-dependent methyltransferase [Actinomycetota bacterium]
MPENRLAERIRQRIKKEGPVPFSEFMRMALYEPQLGYYTSADTEIGKSGDFYTSPHLHPAFGWMIARTIEEMWGKSGRPDFFAIIEQGPGKGLMAKDILDWIRENSPAFYDALNYKLVEMNPAMNEIQQDLLREHHGKIEWHEDISRIQAGIGVLLANELIDAFPVHLIQINGQPLEVFVTLDNGRFTETLAPPSWPAINEYLADFLTDTDEIGPGYRTEVNLDMKRWLLQASRIFEQGFVLVIDYGWTARQYLSPERNRGTLMCYYKHQALEDPYIHVGEQDITAHVNFSALKKWAAAAGLECIGYCEQGTFLVAAGIEKVITGLPVAELAKIKGLILPGTMGETHKVMALYKKGPSEQATPELAGFSLRNRAGTL